MSDDDDHSFDPRTWGGATGGAAPADPPPPKPEKPVKPPKPAKATADPDASAPDTPEPVPRAKPSPLLLGGIGAAAILVAGGVAAFLARPDAAPAPVAATEAPATTPAPAAPVAEAALQARRTLVLGKAADLRDALASAGLDPAEADAAAAAALKVIGKRAGEVRAVLTLVQDGVAQHLSRLEASFEDSSGVVLSRGADGAFAASPVEASLSTRITVVRGEMDANSFYTSAVAAGVTDTLIPDFAKAFAFDFDFQREIHPGDVFEAAFEQQTNAAGQPVGAPKLLYASLTTAEKSRSLYWFAPPGEEGGWFEGNGASIVRALMRTPVDGARVSSQFGYRIHPVLGYQKLHKGTDFAAPIGTPIFAAGDGAVQFAAMKGANGNLTILRHDNGWLTYYLHQNEFAPGVAQGARVRQGQEIGKVGTTGRSTGPHLHYEVHIDGEPVNPLSIQTESGRTLTGDPRAAFIKERDRIDVARAAQAK